MGGVRGFPDWSESKQSVEGGFSGNLDELSVRLGGVGNVFKTGNLWYLFDFENAGINLRYSASGTGNTSSVVNTNSELGNYSWEGRLSSSTAGSANILKDLIIFSELPIGLGFSFSSDRLFTYIQFKMEYFINGYQYFGAIRYRPLNHNWYYLNFIGTEYLIGTYAIQADTNYKLWNYIKLVINPQTGKYSRLHVNDNVFDMSSINLPSAVSSLNNRQLQFIFNVVTTSAFATKSYIDNLYFTYNEPL